MVYALREKKKASPAKCAAAAAPKAAAPLAKRAHGRPPKSPAAKVAPKKSSTTTAPKPAAKAKAVSGPKMEAKFAPPLHFHQEQVSAGPLVRIKLAQQPPLRGAAQAAWAACVNEEVAAARAAGCTSPKPSGAYMPAFHYKEIIRVGGRMVPAFYDGNWAVSERYFY